MVRRAYLDWNATAPLRPEARRALLAALRSGGNASSVHAEGRAARRWIERARSEVAQLVGVEPGCVVFTSGGTEANMLALAPAPGDNGCDWLLASAIEHPSIRSGGRFASNRVEFIEVRPDGRIDLCALARRVGAIAGAGGRALVSIMLANNETGAIQPIADAARIIHATQGLLHVDAVQGPGRMDCRLSALGADLLTISAHKLGGPQGIGALVRRDPGLGLPPPLLRGGGQERGWRAGTENVAAIAGFGAAVAAVRAKMASELGRMQSMREYLEQGLRHLSPEVVIFCAEGPRLANTTLFAVPGVRADTAIIALDLSGVGVSSGSACSSGKVQPSHVLQAMGIDPRLARGAIRVSFGAKTTKTELDCFLDAWQKFTRTLNKGMGGLAA